MTNEPQLNVIGYFSIKISKNQFNLAEWFKLTRAWNIVNCVKTKLLFPQVFPDTFIRKVQTLMTVT